MGIWVEQQFRAAGLETHIDGFAATVNGKDVALQNVWGVAKGRTQGTIMVLAGRDVPPLATQGAGDNASGVAAMLALADAFTVTAHEHTIIFLCTTGDSYGALGAHEFVTAHQTDDLYAVIALRDVAKRDSDGVGLNGWSGVPKTAPPWLWLLAAAGGQARLQPGRRTAGRAGAGAPTGRPHRRRQPGTLRGRRRARHHPYRRRPVRARPERHARHGVAGDAHQGRAPTAQNMVMAVDGTTGARRPERRHDLPHA